MNVIELLTTVIVVFCGYLAGKFLAQSFGVVGWFVGVPLGIIIALGLYVLLRKIVRGRNRSKNDMPGRKE